MNLRCLTVPVCFMLVTLNPGQHVRAENFADLLKPLLTQRCVQCHGADDPNGEVSFHQFVSADDFLKQPDLIQKTLEAIETGAMPPDGEEPLDENTTLQAVVALKAMLREATAGEHEADQRLRRLNRFQYNNTVRDLFQLNRDVFALPEKLMTRHENYLLTTAGNGEPARLPDVVQVASHSLSPVPGLRDVKPFPKDLRAEHGFDNQTDQLTLSPLLLDSFLRLSVSIVESPDFNEQTVGIWNDFFREPDPADDRNAVVRSRLKRFLRIAFRGPVDDETLERYAAYTTARINNGLPFTDAMKKVASATLSSPMFLYRSPPATEQEELLALASRMSYFLWGSCPDDELLRLAETGDLTRPEVINSSISRMLTDPKIERFLDSFPSQWMQLENLLAVTPDPGIARYFNVDRERPASVQMVLEPLLLFDAVFTENRPVVDLVAPEFTYRSDFLQAWYESDLTPPPVDLEQIAADNRRKNQRREELQTAIASARQQLGELLDPVRTRLLKARRASAQSRPPVDLKPYAAWDFDGDLKEPIRGLDLTAHGDIEFQDGMVVLDRDYLLSKPLPVDLKAKTLEVWFRLQNLDQPGGGLMGIQGPGGLFDTIVIGERKNRHWISGSNGFQRTEDFPESFEESVTDDMLHLAMVYTDDGTTALYRNGQPYGQPYRKGQLTFPLEETSVIFGLRHLPAGGNRFLTVTIDRARLYDRALTIDEIEASLAGQSDFVTRKELTAALTPDQKAQLEELESAIEQTETELKQVPENVDPAQATRDANQRFEDELRQKVRSQTFRRVAVSDPRYGGIITNAATLSMTSGPKRTHPVARGVWIVEVIFNNPPPPPPNNVPPLNEDAAERNLTIREKFAMHRENPACAGCHTKLDPLGFALENFDITGRWRDQYENGRTVDSGGTLLRRRDFDGAVQFKDAIVEEQRLFAKAFIEHLLRFALARELGPSDAVTADTIPTDAEPHQFRLVELIRAVALSDSFRHVR